MGVGQELTNGLEGVGHVFSFMVKQKKSPPPPHINNDRSLTMCNLIKRLIHAAFLSTPASEAKTNGTDKRLKLQERLLTVKKRKYNSVKHLQRQQFSFTKTSIKVS